MYQTSLTPISRMSARERPRLKFDSAVTIKLQIIKRETEQTQTNYYLSWIRRKAAAAATFHLIFPFFRLNLSRQQARITHIPSSSFVFFTFDCCTLTGNSRWSLYPTLVIRYLRSFFCNPRSCCPTGGINSRHDRSISSFHVSLQTSSPVHSPLHCRINGRPRS